MLQAKAIQEQAAEINKENLIKTRRAYQEQGIGTAYEGKQLVTIGDSECDYDNWKEFIVAQLFRLGPNRLSDLTDWALDDLQEQIANTDPYDGTWLDAAQDGFDAIGGDY